MTDKSDNPNPLKTAGFFSKLCFWWLYGVSNYGNEDDVELKDLYDTLPEDRSENLRNDLERAWKDELSRKSTRKPSVAKAIIRVYRWKFIKYMLLFILSFMIQLLQPLLLQMVMSYFHRSTITTKLEAYMYVTILVSLMAMHIFVMRQGSFGLMLIGMQIKTAISSLMYKKLIRLSSTGGPSNSGSSIVNLLSNDVSSFETICYSLPCLLILPLQLFVCTIVISYQVGYFAGLIGIALIILQTLPPQIFIYLATLKIRPKLLSRSDARISLLNEIINGIQAIKMYVWENYFRQLVQIARSKEIHYYLQISYCASIAATFASFSQRSCTFVILLICTLRDEIVTSDKIIPVTQYLSILGEIITGYFFESVENIAHVKVSVQRTQEFLLREEKRYNNIKKLNAGDHRRILLEKVRASWDPERIELTVDNVNFDVTDNELCIVIGSVGCGKSTLLKLILGEINPISGDIYVQGNISYTSQEPWLFPASIRENILFGDRFDEKWYEEVTKACSLIDDFDQMPYGDKTLVGDRGITLSGGQRARINMARSIYRKADIYLLDDPLAAVDARVAGQLFENCINGVLKNKTRVLVTNNFQYLHLADKVILLKQGEIKYVGDYAGFRDNKAFLTSYLSSLETPESKPGMKISDSDESSPLIPEPEKNIQPDDEPEEIEELMETGNVSASLYWRYIRASRSYIVLVMFLIFSILVILAMAGFDYYLADSTQMEELSEISNSMVESEFIVKPIIRKEIMKSLYIFAELVLMIVVTATIKNILFFKLTLNASKNIHNEMFTRILGTPLKFYETNPPGRILNRFSEDTRCVDDLLPRKTFYGIECLSMAAGLLIPVLVINVWLTLPIFIIGYLFYRLSVMYVKTAQRMKRLEGIARSPVLSFATSSLAGAVTIRSFQVEPEVCKDFDSRQDTYIKVYFMITAWNQAFACWIELLMTGLFAVVGYSCVIFKTDDEFSAFIGLSLMQIMNVTGLLSFMSLQFTDVLARMVNVERMFQFTELEQEETEKSSIIDDKSKLWPDAGRIKFEHVNLWYSADSEPVLNDLNFTIEPGTKVGIVGRTGAGKSSLIAALFRLTKIDGSLLIDGIDIKNVDLSDLRSRISIIPQVPTLFSASLRENLDPLNKHDDIVLWSALEDVELNKISADLDFKIEKGGSNLSSGQRQLLCLARAIIAKNKILIMDEATANVDLATDEFIQKTIRNKFNDCTVLTIAHRLNTIMDSDKILVMDNGRAVEYDHPHLLMQNNNSLFYNLVQKTGQTMAQNLENIAKKAYRK